jgi:hypothetical protein
MHLVGRLWVYSDGSPASDGHANAFLRGVCENTHVMRDETLEFKYRSPAVST